MIAIANLWYLILGTAFIVYVIFDFVILKGLFNLRRVKSPPESETAPKPVSIVIAAKDEEQNINTTIESLLNQSYPLELLEIIIVDDNSTDRTAEIVLSLAQQHPNIKLLQLNETPTNTSPKKFALAQGIGIASHNLILLSDADCEMPQRWVKTMINPLCNGYQMVIGQARFKLSKNEPIWQHLQSLDYIAQSYAAMGLANSNIPFNCSGASIGFHKLAYEEVKGWSGYTGLISGDDELLLAKFHNENYAIKPCSNRHSIVQTAPPKNLNELWNQRVRWASKGLHYSTLRKWTLTGVFFFYVSLTIAPLMLIITPHRLLPVAVMFAVKLLLDGIIIRKGSKLYGDNIAYGTYFSLALLHPPLISLLAILGNFSGFKWHGRSYKRGMASQ